MDFSEIDKARIRQFLECIGESTINGLSTEDALWALADPGTKQLVDKVLALDPGVYGFRGPHLSLDEVPHDAVAITGRTDNFSGEYELGTNTYLPAHVFAAFSVMAEVFGREYPGRQLLAAKIQ